MSTWADKDIWETPAKDIAYRNTIMVVEDFGNCYIFGDSVTLSRTVPLYKECGFDASVSLSENGEGIYIAAMIIPATLDELTDAHWALEHLKGGHVDVWSWRMMSEHLCEAVNVPTGKLSAPLLAVVMDGSNEMRVFGQVEDINVFSHTCESFGIRTFDLLGDGKVTGFAVNATHSAEVVDHIETAGHHVICRTWSPYESE